MYNDGTMTVTNSSFLNNTQSDAAGAVYNDGTMTMLNITFQGNSSTQMGGAIYNDYGVLQVSNSFFTGNTSPSGGAIYADGNSTGNLATVQNSTFTGNNDSAINVISPIVIANSTFSGNTSATAGAVQIGTGSTGSIIRNTTINGNTVTGGGNAAVSVASGASLTVQNSIVAGNGGLATSTGNCAGCTFAGNNVIDVNPELLALGNNGSPTPQVPALQTLLPMPGSPAVGAGALATDTTDERGYPRPTVSGTTSCYDIGAVQTAYALAFTQQPTDTLVSAVITPAPAVQLTEQAAGVSGIPVVMTASTGTLSGTASQTTNGTGIATFANLSINAANAETLTATVGTLSVSSNSFNVTAPTPPPSAPTAAVMVANQQVNAGSTASLSATVTYSGTLPTGAFTFQVNAGSIVPATCRGPASPETCTASYPTTGLAAQTYTIRGSLAADSQYAAASGTGTLTIIAVTAPSFSLTAGGTTAATVTSGGIASYNFALAPPTSGSYPGAVSFAVTGLPTGATSTFSPSTIAATSSAQTVTLQVQTAVSTAGNERHAPLGPAAVPILFVLLGLPFCFSRKLRSKLNTRLLAIVLLVGGIAGFAGITGCGSGSSGMGSTQTSQTYNLTVTATSGSVQQS